MSVLYCCNAEGEGRGLEKVPTFMVEHPFQESGYPLGLSRGLLPGGLGEGRGGGGGTGWGCAARFIKRLIDSRPKSEISLAYQEPMTIFIYDLKSSLISSDKITENIPS